MNYRLTALTPLLVGDGQKLSPIDYMVWKDQVNVLDQRRIFRLLAKGPRLESYLAQLRKAEKLDFASWGGFAQNFAGRRIPFEHSSSTTYWEQARAENLFIPTFCSGPNGPYLPGSAIKGALRTGLVFTRWNSGVLREIASRMDGDRGPRKPGESAELMTLGPSTSDPMRVLSTADSNTILPSAFKIYLLKVSTLQQRPGKFEVGWKPNPTFAEMATPGSVFTGEMHEIAWRRRNSAGVEQIFKAANQHAAKLIAAQKHYADTAELPRLKASLESLEASLAAVGQSGCIINLGWGAGLLGKAAFLDTEDEEYRKILRTLPFYSKAIRSGMPFPKTRRIVFEGNQPATLPGWAKLEM
jgi:CRISPR-associated protein Csm5